MAAPPGSAFPRINGGRPRVNEYLFDGVSVLQPEPGQVAFTPVVDAIDEFKVETNSPSAEFGRFNGGVINLPPKSGSNSLSGSAFAFTRHESLNARNAFAPAGGDKPVFRRQQFGGVAGGPIARDRTFFFADYQGTRQEIGRVRISTVADAAAAPGHLSPRRSAAACRRSTIPRPTRPATGGSHRQRSRSVREQHDPRESHRPGGARAPRSLSAPDILRHRQQLHPRRQRNDRSGSVRCADRSPHHHFRSRFRAPHPTLRDLSVPVTPLSAGSSGNTTTGAIGPLNHQSVRARARTTRIILRSLPPTNSASATPAAASIARRYRGHFRPTSIDGFQQPRSAREHVHRLPHRRHPHRQRPFLAAKSAHIIKGAAPIYASNASTSCSRPRQMVTSASARCSPISRPHHQQRLAARELPARCTGADVLDRRSAEHAAPTRVGARNTSSRMIGSPPRT